MTDNKPVTRDQIMAALVKIQNKPSNWNFDIISITAGMTDRQLKEHLERNMNRKD